MKYLVTGDVHMHPKTKKLDEIFWKDLISLYDKHKVDGLLILGDLIDIPRISLEYYLWLQDLLRGYFSVRNLEVPRAMAWLLGNHESVSREDPTVSCLRYFENFGKLVETITKPHVQGVGKNTIFFFLPWMPGKKLKVAAIKLAAIASEKKYERCKKVLFCHAGLKEGEVSDDYRVHQEVSIKDLSPDVFDLILLGDYHRHQFLTENAFYVGSPFPRSFKDTKSVGVWLLDTGGPEVSCEALALPSAYPQYKSYQIRSLEDLAVSGYDSSNVNRLEVDISLVERARSLYPGAQVLPKEYMPVLDRGRLQNVESSDAEAVFLELLKQRNIRDKNMKILGVEYIQKAKGIK